MAKRKIEVFTAGCPLCDDAVKLVKKHLGNLDQRILEMVAFREVFLARWHERLDAENVPDRKSCGLTESESL